MKKQFTLIKLVALIPVMGICLFLARVHYQASTGLVYRVKIRGYDPRDLLHGHYLRYTFDLPTKSLLYKDLSLSRAKYCFTYSQETEYQIKLMPNTAKVRKCSSVLNYSKLKGSHKYFVPEEYALDLERKLRDRKVTATVELIINQTNNFSMGQLYLDGLPWEEALIKDKEIKSNQ